MTISALDYFQVIKRIGRDHAVIRNLNLCKSNKENVF